MQYILLVYLDEKRFGALSVEDQDRIHGEAVAWQAELEAAGKAREQKGLHAGSTATTVRQKNGKLLISDGPCAEAREVLGSFSVVECRDLDEALAISKRFPGLRAGLAVEVRPCFAGDPRVHRARADGA